MCYFSPMTIRYAITLFFLIVAGSGCSTPPTEIKEVPTDQLPDWDEVQDTTHTKASRPPEPVLIIDLEGKECFKVYTVFRSQIFRLPNGQAYSIRDCSQNCGTEISCPGWAEEVRSDWATRNKPSEEITPKDGVTKDPKENSTDASPPE